MTQPEAGVIHCGLAILENSKPEIKQHLTKSCRVLKLVQHIYIRKAASSAYIRESHRSAHTDSLWTVRANANLKWEIAYGKSA